jgi:hypothetical protein
LTKGGAAKVADCLISFGRFRGHPYPYFSSLLSLWQGPLITPCRRAY